MSGIYLAFGGRSDLERRIQSGRIQTATGLRPLPLIGTRNQSDTKPRFESEFDE